MNGVRFHAVLTECDVHLEACTTNNCRQDHWRLEPARPTLVSSAENEVSLPVDVLEVDVPDALFGEFLRYINPQETS